MPKKACCCNPIGRHVAVACRYYGRHTVYSLNADVGFTGSSSGNSGSSGGSNEKISTGIEYGYGGPDGFQGVTSGPQKIFAWAANEPSFGNDQSGFIHRGPVRWDVSIKQFDTSRDVVLLSRSGGGSSQYETDENKPKGGHAALLQSRIKASLDTEVFDGIGGSEYLGGSSTIIGSNLSSPFIVGGGAGGGGGDDNRGGWGGITFGYRGAGPFGGYGGLKTQGGTAGGPSAGAGLELIGGSGANSGGGGGGGWYGGGGGDQKSGGGGGASKWPDSSQISDKDDVKFSEPGSDNGPGGVCDPFIGYYPLDTTVFGFHAGLGGGANVIFNQEADQSLNSITRFLGFGYDYNPYKEGIPGIVTAVWVDKYCPCTQNLEGATGEIEIGSENTPQSPEEENTSTDLPAKMYICLTDEQYEALETYREQNGGLNTLNYHLRFTLNGETYIYFGICVNSYCPSLRLETGTPTNISEVELGGNGAASYAVTYSDCCDVMICSRYCKLPAADCYSCRCNTTCLTDLSKPKYCCENLDEKPDEYWSVSEGWVWRCRKRKKFWYPFGVTPEDTLPPTHELTYDGMAVSGPFEKGCLPITASGLSGAALDNFLEENCFPPNPNLNCSGYVGWNSPNCSQFLPKKYWEGKTVFPINVNGDLCNDLKDHQLYAFSTSLPVDCTCVPTDVVSCVNVGCNRESKNYSFSFSLCDLTPAFGGSYVGMKYTGCSNVFSPDGKISCSVDQGSNYFNTRNAPICREVLGMTVRIPRCHPDPDNPQITDTPKYGIPGVGNSYNTFPSEYGWIEVCEKRVTGYGTLGDFVSAVTSNLQMDIEITVNEPRLWLSIRPYIRPCDELDTFQPSDLVYRIQITETLDYQLVEYYFIPVGVYFKVSAQILCREFGSFQKYLGEDSVCNPACECQANKVFEQDTENSNSSTFCYFSEPYYLFEKSGGETPTLVRGVFEQTPEFGNSPDNGLCVMPESLKEQICPPSPDSIYDLGFAGRSKASCGTFTVGSFPDCNTTSSIEQNACYSEFLEISYG